MIILSNTLKCSRKNNTLKAKELKQAGTLDMEQLEHNKQRRKNQERIGTEFDFPGGGCRQKNKQEGRAQTQRGQNMCESGGACVRGCQEKAQTQLETQDVFQNFCFYFGPRRGGIWGFPGQGSDLSLSCDHSSVKTRSFNPLCWGGDQTCVLALQGHH